MPFDAGSIEAELVLNRAQFNADLAQELAAYQAFKAKLESGVTIPLRYDSRGIGVATVGQMLTSDALKGIDLTKVGLIGSDPGLLKRLEQEAATPGGIGILGIGTDSNLQRLLRQALENAASKDTSIGILGLGSGSSASDLQKVFQKLVGPSPNATAVVQPVTQKLVSEVSGGVAPTEIQPVIQKIVGSEGGLGGVPWVIPAMLKILNPGGGEAGTDTITAKVDDAGALITIAQLKAAIDGVLEGIRSIKIGADDAPAIATIAALQRALMSLNSAASASGGNQDAFARIAAELISIRANSADAEGGISAFANGLNDAKQGASAFSGTLKNLLPASFFFGTATALGWTHLAADAFIELAAVVVPAGIALAALGGSLVALTPDMATVYQRELNMYNAFDTLGQKLPGVTGSLNALNAEFRPQVFAVWGDALTLVNSKTGLLQGLLQTSTKYLDEFAARIVVDLQDGSGAFDKLLKSGESDLVILGRLIATLGNAIFNLIKVTEETHIAQDLFGVLQFFADILDAVTKLPTPILAVVVALHGLYLWGGLAISGLLKIGQAIPGVNQLGKALDDMAASILTSQRGIPFVVQNLEGVGKAADGTAVKVGVMETSLALLKSVPVWGWVAAGAIALLGLAIAFSKTNDAEIEWANNLEKAALAANQFRQFNAILGAMQQLHGTILTITANQYAYNQSLSQFQKASGEAKDSAEAMRLENEKLATDKSWQQLFTGLQNYGQGVEYIMKTFHVDYPTALAIAEQANVNLSKSLDGNSKSAQQARQQILGLVSGFAQLQTPAGVAGRDFEALAFASNDITQKIQSLNTAWATWIGTVTGSESNFVTFAQGMATLGADAKATGASMGGLNASSLTLQSQFVTQVTSLNSLIGAYRSAYATGNVTTKQMNNMTLAVKAGVAALIPYAEGNKTATAQLFALAQEADYTGKDSLSSLASWAGIKAPNALKILQGTTQDATIAASNLANTIQHLLNVQFQADIIQASGANQALKNYTTALVNNQQNTNAGYDARQQLIHDLEKAGLSAQDATSYVDGLSRSLGKVPTNITTQIHEELSSSGSANLKATGVYLQTGVGHLVAYAQGTHGARPGWGIVGEQGPEAVLFSGGEQVVPNHMLGAVSGLPGYAGGTMAPGAGASWVDQSVGRNFGHALQNMQASFNAGVIAALKQSLAHHFIGSGGIGGTATPGLMTIARYLIANGASIAAAAGIAGTIAGESGGDPEALQAGGGGAGILQWTPASSAYPIQPIVTGNPGRDMAVQLLDMLAYIQDNGGMGLLNAAGREGPMGAAWVFSVDYERPLIPGSDIRAGAVASIYAALGGKGGVGNPGTGLTYDSGGILGTGMWGYNAGPPERILSPAQTQTYDTLSSQKLIDRLDTLIDVMQRNPSATSAGLGQVLSGVSRRATYAGMYSPPRG